MSKDNLTMGKAIFTQEERFPNYISPKLAQRVEKTAVTPREPHDSDKANQTTVLPATRQKPSYLNRTREKKQGKTTKKPNHPTAKPFQITPPAVDLPTLPTLPPYLST